MKQFFSRLSVGIYAVVCVVTLAWWLPHFIASNLTLVPEADYRYIAATGVPFGLFLLGAVARQSLADRLELFVVLQVFLTAITLYACKLTFYYTPQSTFFCPLHVWLCVAFILVNLYQYRRRLKALAPKTAEA
jgi:hypothetical protein